MTRNQLTPDYSVSGQLLPEDFANLAAEGVACIINNRPDVEVPPELSSARMREAAEAAGLEYVENPVVGSALGLEIGETQAKAITGAKGPVHAYCGSGMRSSVAWAMAQAGTQDIDAILHATEDAGFPLHGIRPILESLAATKG